MNELTPSCAILFPGQGSQYAGMADSWAEHPVGRAVFEEASDIIGYDIELGCHEETRLATTDFAQPAILACEVAAFRILDGLDIPCKAVAGHSLGQFSALVAAGVITLSEALNVVGIRGLAMQQAGKEQPGTMAALLRVNTEEARELCNAAADDDVLIVANENSPTQVVISGSIPAIERAEALAHNRNIRAIRLNVAGAFHSVLMQPAVQPIIEALNKIELKEPRFPIAENVAGVLVNNTVNIRSLLERHVVSPVKWEASVRALGAIGITTFIEAGPGKALTGLTKRILTDVRLLNVDSPQAAVSVAAAIREG